MYIEKMMSINGIALESYPFEREVFLEGFLTEHLNHISPPGYEASGLDPVNQIQIKGGGPGDSDGRIDLAFELAAEESNTWVLAELKVWKLTVAHLNQLLRYLAQDNQLVKGIQNRLGRDVSPRRWIGVLVGESIEADLAAALVNGTWTTLPGVELPPGFENRQDVEIGAAVIQRFRERGSNAVYVMADKYFLAEPSGNTRRDYSKFSFDEGTNWYGAGKFVREYIKDYCRRMQPKEMAELAKVFPKALQGNFEVVASEDKVRDHSRYTSEVYELGMGGYVVCTQWGYANGSGNLAKFIANAKKLGSHVYRRTADGITTRL